MEAPVIDVFFRRMPDAKYGTRLLEAGILGPVAGLIGTLQALETIKLILGSREP